MSVEHIYIMGDFSKLFFTFQPCQTTEVQEYYKLSNSFLGEDIILRIFRVFNLPNSDLTMSSFMFL